MMYESRWNHIVDRIQRGMHTGLYIMEGSDRMHAAFSPEGSDDGVIEGIFDAPTPSRRDFSRPRGSLSIEINFQNSHHLSSDMPLSSPFLIGGGPQGMDPKVRHACF